MNEKRKWRLWEWEKERWKAWIDDRKEGE